MIEISFGKLLVLALIALIVLGPEKLPAAARTAGALLRRVRIGWDSVRAEVERELQVDEIRRTARDAVARADAAQADLDATLRQVREVAAEAGATVTGSAPAADPAAPRPADAHAGVTPADAASAGQAGLASEPTGADTHTGDLFAAGVPAAAPVAGFADPVQEQSRGSV